jgi:hypothetical protein
VLADGSVAVAIGTDVDVGNALVYAFEAGDCEVCLEVALNVSVLVPIALASLLNSVGTLVPFIRAFLSMTSCCEGPLNGCGSSAVAAVS